LSVTLVEIHIVGLVEQCRDRSREAIHARAPGRGPETHTAAGPDRVDTTTDEDTAGVGAEAGTRTREDDALIHDPYPHPLPFVISRLQAVSLVASLAVYLVALVLLLLDFLRWGWHLPLHLLWTIAIVTTARGVGIDPISVCLWKKFEEDERWILICSGIAILNVHVQPWVPRSLLYFSSFCLFL